MAIADWKMDEEQFDDVIKMKGWSRLSAQAQALAEASYQYYLQGKFPSTELVSLTPPALIVSPSVKGVAQ
ncbi:hypothetical protein D3C87_1927040 [compost metagenome]